MQVQEPRLWPSLISSLPKPLSHRLLSLASGVYDLQFWTKRLRVEKWTENEIGLTLLGEPWAEILGEQANSLSSSSALLELCLRLVWESEAVARGPLKPLQFERVDWEFLRPLQGTMTATYKVEPNYRDQVLFDLQKSGRCHLEGVVQFFNSRKGLVAQAHFRAQFASPRVLAGSTEL